MHQNPEHFLPDKALKARCIWVSTDDGPSMVHLSEKANLHIWVFILSLLLLCSSHSYSSLGCHPNITTWSSEAPARIGCRAANHLQQLPLGIRSSIYPDERFPVSRAPEQYWSEGWFLGQKERSYCGTGRVLPLTLWVFSLAHRARFVLWCESILILYLIGEPDSIIMLW